MTTVTLPSGITVPYLGSLLASCPKADEHSVYPADFDLDRDDAAGEIVPSLTHVQRTHETCGLWAIWEPREVSEEPDPTALLAVETVRVQHGSGDDILVGCLTCYQDGDGSSCVTPEADPKDPGLCRWCSHTVEPVPA